MVFCKINVRQQKKIKMVAHGCGRVDTFKVGKLTDRFIFNFSVNVFIVNLSF